MGSRNLIFVRPFFIEDYPEIEKWFEKRKDWPKAPKPQILPTTGFIAHEMGGKMHAAAWLYLSYNSTLAFLEWSVTNPDLPARQALSSLKLLIKTIQEKVSLLDPPVTDIIQFMPSERLAGFYEKHLDFKAGEKATLMVWSRS